MAAPSAQEPSGWDEDPARRPDEPDGGPLPDETTGWHPDPMSAQDREAWLDHLVAQDDPFDQEEWPDPEDCVPLPGEDVLTAQELAEIDEAAAAEAGGQAETARLGGTLGAMAVRRGPGQAGLGAGAPRRVVQPGGGVRCRDGAGCHTGVPGAGLSADAAAGDDDRYEGASDAELIGVLLAWDRLEAHMAARKLAAVAELIR